MMKNFGKILLTNLINIGVILIFTYLFAFVNAFSDATFNFKQSISSASNLIFLYGLPFWLILIIAFLLCDTFFFKILKLNKKNIKNRLIIESILVSSPFIYWIIVYKEWIFLLAILAYFLGQYLGKNRILKIME